MRHSGSVPIQFRERVDEYYRHGKNLHLVYVPTHRDCAEVLGEIAREVRAAAAGSIDEYQLLLIDDRPGTASEANRLAAARIADEVGVVVNQLGLEAWRGFVAALVERSDLSDVEADYAREALLKPTGSYASGMNKASLLAAYLGADTLHRRDSDEFPAYDDNSGASTLEVEVTALSTPLPMGSGEELAPYVVGTSVDGEPTKDHRDLISASPELAVELAAIGRRRQRPGEVVPDPVVVPLPVGRLHVERDLTGRTQVGVSASREVHHWIPEMPAVGVLGTDHFQKGLLYQVDLPVAWHPLSARHEYEPWRSGQTSNVQLGRYAVAELRHVVLRHYWNTANEVIAARGRAMFDGDRFRSEVFADVFTDVLVPDHGPAEAVAAAFIDVYARAAHLASGDTAARLHTRVEALRAESPRVVGYVRDSVLEFVRLVRLWPRLVTGAAVDRGPHPL